MDTDAILSFQAPSRDGARVTCGPSPVIELAYVHFFLLERLGAEPRPRPEMPWLGGLLDEHAELVAALRAFAPDRGLSALSPALLVLAARYGYVRDEDPRRFLHDLPSLATRFVEDDGFGDKDDDDEKEHMAQFLATMSTLEEASHGEALRDLLTDLWEALEPTWERDGRAAVARATNEFRTAFERTGSVLESLPAHHFTRFEEMAHGIREAEERGRVVVVPLHLASTGGFSFLIDDVQYVGYGLKSESDFERTAQQLSALATRAKVLGDPTRLMVLLLVGRFSSMHLTVGDLADQIGVSQPTVSGHLKLLRDAGLVAAERRGNKTYHRLERDALRRLLDELGGSLLD
jgi:ArsR family transcriptional regulator, arsenate/arsenite/antimonite-responsive transcriptional repressor